MVPRYALPMIIVSMLLLVPMPTHPMMLTMIQSERLIFGREVNAKVISTPSTTIRTSTHYSTLAADSMNTGRFWTNFFPEHQNNVPVLWEYYATEFEDVYSDVIGGDYRVYFAGFNATTDIAKVICLDSITGHKIWDISISQTEPILSNLELYGNYIWFGTSESISIGQARLWCIDINGSFVWSKDWDLNITGIKYHNGYLYVVGIDFTDPSKTTLYKVRSSDGSIEWTYNLAIPAFPPTWVPAVTSDKVIVSSYNGDYVIALDHNGNLKWTYIYNNTGDLCSRPVIDIWNDRVYVGTTTGYIVQIDLNTGDANRIERIDDYPIYALSYLYTEDKLYCIPDNSNIAKIYGVWASNLTVNWSTIVGSSTSAIASTYPIAKNNIVVAVTSNIVTAHDVSDGRLLYRLSTDPDNEYIHAALIDGMLFLMGRGTYSEAPKIRVYGNRPPEASIVVDPTYAYTYVPITFNGSYSSDPDGDPLAYFWDFDDGTEMGGGGDLYKIVQHQYTDDGIYYVSLTVTDGIASNTTRLSSYTAVRIFNRAPSTELVATTYSAYTYDVIWFSAQSAYDMDGTVVAYLFDFGDGTNSSWTTSSSVSHVYTDDGVYNVSLIVKDDDGAVSIPVNVTISIYNRKPKVTNLLINNTLPYTHQMVNFTVVAEDQDGTIEKYFFDFGDGNTSGWIKSNTVSHAYSNSGQYIVGVMVMDDDGAESEIYSMDLTVLNRAPIAKIKMNRSNVYTYDSITFWANWSYDYDGKIVLYRWDFDDGNLSESEVVEHYYTDNGIYNVKLTVTDDKGANASVIMPVTIYNRPPKILGVTVSNATVYTYQSLYINVTAIDQDGEIKGYELTGQNLNFTGMFHTNTIKVHFLDDGIYNVTVRAVDDDNNVSLPYCIQVTVLNRRPKIYNISVNKTEIYVGEEVHIAVNVTDDGTIVSYNWYCHENNNWYNTSNNSVNLTFNEVGGFNLTVYVYDDDGVCTTANITLMVLNRAPIAELIVPNSTLQYNNTSIIVAVNDPDGHKVNWYIDFGDGNKSVWHETQIATEYHIWYVPDTYNVTLIAIDIFGAVTSVSIPLLVIADTDGDGIPDDQDKDIDNDGLPNHWELAHGLDPYDSSDAMLDSDNDNFTNLAEYLNGTDPMNAESHPSLPSTTYNGTAESNNNNPGQDKSTSKNRDLTNIYFTVSLAIILICIAIIVIIIRKRPMNLKRDLDEFAPPLIAPEDVEIISPDQKPKIHTLNEKIKCNLCMGNIKNQAEIFECSNCGLKYHYSCINRMGKCVGCGQTIGVRHKA